MRVIKIGGNDLGKPDFTTKFACSLKDLSEPIIVVHGGGKEVDDLQIGLGQQPVKILGMRQTDAQTLRAALMVLCGLVSKQLVAALIDAGFDALSLSGVDGGLIRVRKLNVPEVELGFVGEIVAVRAELLMRLLTQGITPVISPISLGLDGQIYNVNADQAASAIALALKAESIDFVSNVPGVLQNHRLLPCLNPEEAEDLIARNEIGSGMVPKVRAAILTSREGVANVRIVNLANLTKDGGTRIAVKNSQTSHNSSYSIPGVKP